MSDLSEFLKALNAKTKLEQDKKKYPIFIGNRILSYHRDCIHFVNEIQQYKLDADIQYDFLNAIIQKGYRYKQYHKIPQELYELRGLISKYYNASIEEADKILPLLGESEIKHIKKMLDQGGLKK